MPKNDSAPEAAQVPMPKFVYPPHRAIVGVSGPDEPEPSVQVQVANPDANNFDNGGRLFRFGCCDVSFRSVSGQPVY